MSRTSVLLTLLLSATAQARDPEAVLELVTGSPHGEAPIAGDDFTAALGEVLADADTYVPLLEASLDPARVEAAAGSSEAQRRLAAAAALLARLAKPEVTGAWLEKLLGRRVELEAEL